MKAPLVARRLQRFLPETVVVAVLVLGSGVGSLLLGQDANTDLHRYRFYIGYAFVHGRLDYDLVPAGLGTFLNPVLDSIHYLGITHLPPRVLGFLLGALQGLNPALVFLMARRLLVRGPGSLTLAVLVGVLAAMGSTARSLLGTTMGDTTASIPLLLSLLLVLGGRESLDAPAGARLWLGAGFLAGASVALKLTMGPPVLALGALVVLMVLRRHLRVGAAVRIPRRQRPRLPGHRGLLVLAAVGALRQPALSVRQPDLPVTVPARRGDTRPPLGDPGSLGPRRGARF